MNRNKSLQTIVISLFSIAFASLSTASENSYRLVSATKAYQLSFNQLQDIQYVSSGSQSSFLKLGLNKDQQKALKELLSSQEGSSLAIIHNGIWIRTLDVFSPEIGDNILFSISNDMKPPYPTTQDTDTLLQFILEEEYQLPSKYQLPEEKTAGFEMVLEKDALSRLCASSHVYLFEKDTLIAQSTICENDTIILKFTE